MRGIVFAVMIGAGLAVAQVAAAQPPSVQAQASAAMYCVYKRVTEWDQAKVVAHVFLSDETPEADIGRAALIVERAAKVCAETQGLADGTLAAARDIGMYGVAMDLLAAQLIERKATQEAVEGVFAAYNGLALEERRRLFEDNWRSNLAFHQKLAAAVAEKGVPEDDLSVELAFQILELSAMTEENVRLFKLGERTGG
jgi:hypothetical protein